MFFGDDIKYILHTAASKQLTEECPSAVKPCSQPHTPDTINQGCLVELKECAKKELAAACPNAAEVCSLLTSSSTEEEIALCSVEIETCVYDKVYNEIYSYCETPPEYCCESAAQYCATFVASVDPLKGDYDYSAYMTCGNSVFECLTS